MAMRPHPAVPEILRRRSDPGVMPLFIRIDVTRVDLAEGR